MKLLIIILLAAQLNYNNAIDCAKHTNGTDMQITFAMNAHGFNGDVNGNINTIDKIKALYINVVSIAWNMDACKLHI